MLKDLIKLANHLDQKGLRKEADHLDFIIRKLAQDEAQTEAQAEDFQLIFVNGKKAEDKYSNDTLESVKNTGNIILEFVDILGNKFKAKAGIDDMKSTHMDDVIEFITDSEEFTADPTDAAMKYAKLEALRIYSMLHIDYNVFKGKSKKDFDDEDEDSDFIRRLVQAKTLHLN